MRILAILGFIAALFGTAPAGASVVYVNGAAAGAGDGSSMSDAFTTIGSALSAAVAGDTLEIAGGLYVENLASVRDGVSVAASETPGYDEPVTVRGIGNTPTLTVRHAGTWRGLRIEADPTAADSGVSVLHIQAGNPVFENCVLGPGQRLAYLNGSGAVFTRCVFQNALRPSVGAAVDIKAANSDATFDYCMFTDLGYGYINVQSAGRIELNNCMLAGFAGSILFIHPAAEVSQHVALTNSLAMGNGSQYAPMIRNDAPAVPVTVRRSLVLPPGLRGSYDVTAGNVSVVDPVDPPVGLRRGRRPALVAVVIDDYKNLDVWARLADECELYGFKTTLALDTGRVTQEDWARIAAYAARGHEIASHTVNHVPLTLRDVLDVRYDNPQAAAAILSVNRATMRLRVSVSGAPGTELDLDLAEDGPTPTVRDLQAAISAVPGYTASLRAVGTYNSGPWLARDLAAVPGVSILGGTVTLSLDEQAAFDDEIGRSRQEIESRLPGTACTTLVYPNLENDAAVREAAVARGYLAGREGVNGSFALGAPAGYDLMRVFAMRPGSTFGRGIDEAELQSRVSAMLEFAKFTGAALSLYSHGENEYSLDEWSTLLRILAADQDVRVLPLRDLAAEVAAAAEQKSGTVCFRSSFPEVADFRPLASSPLVDAGVPVAGLDADFIGAPVPHGPAPDTGLHEWPPNFGELAAVAGPGQEVDDAAQVVLDGSASLAPGGSSHAWSQVAGPAVELAGAGATASFTAPSFGAARLPLRLRFKLAVSEPGGRVDEDYVNVDVTWQNDPPQAVIAADAAVPAGSRVWLDGSGSFDPDNAVVSHAWTQTSGPAVSLEDASAAAAGFLAPEVGPEGAELRFELRVTDASGAADTAAVTQQILYDSDADGMADFWEFAHFGGLERDGHADADADGLSDLSEFQHGTDPGNPDSDTDGMDDAFEVRYGLAPLDPEDADGDADADGYGNLEEYLAGSDPRDPLSVPGGQRIRSSMPPVLELLL